MLDRLKAAFADRYAMDREIGRNAVTVYLAEDLKHHCKVAIKVLRPELAGSRFAEHFLREIEITSKLRHPHILPMHDSGVVGGSLFCVIPCVQGKSLRDRLLREKQIEVWEAVRIASEVAEALDHVHRQHVFHRNVKPENVVLAAGHALLVDFGIARAVAEAGSEGTIDTEIAVGTPEYMSPEQASPGHQLDGRSDIYSLGCVLFEMLAGEPPFRGINAKATIAKHAVELPPSVRTIRRSIPGYIEAAISKALEKAPVDRFESARDFAQTIQRR
jgi:serine/threonine-protein kinase